MKSTMITRVGLLRVTALFVLLTWVMVDTGQHGVSAAASGSDYIEGVVTSSKGPEAGVWVIAETDELGTKYAKVVVTDDRGRYVLPQLPKANYKVWVRGYGLSDSAPVKATPGQSVNLKAMVAPDGRAAAQIYPANYWLSLVNIPSGKLTADVVAGKIKQCMECHQLGDKATREIPPATQALGSFKNTSEVWDHRTKVGPSGASMGAQFLSLGDQRSLFSDWTDRIVAGEFPKDAPPRPKGVERNIVLTWWDWGSPTDYMHDEAASDSRNPRVSANGWVYGVVASSENLLWLDPVKNMAGELKVPSEATPTGSMNLPSPYWGSENIRLAAAQPRSSAIDEKGRAWFSARIRENDKQAQFCKTGSTNKFAQYFPLDRGNKQVGFYDGEKKEFSEIDTCFTTDHNEFAPDGSLFFGQTGSIGWVDSKIWDKTHNNEASQGWLPAVLDTNGDGKITKPWTEPNEPIDSKKDHRITFGCYAISVSPVDSSVWCSGLGLEQRKLVRIELGSNPPETSKAEVYEPPTGKQPELFSVGGVMVDSTGVAWQNWRGSDYVTSFDRRKCKVLNGPTATGQHCPEGYSFYRRPGPTFGGAQVNSDLNYLMFVDRYGILGLGKDTPVTGAVNSDAMLALLPKTGEWVTIRLPYPLGYFPRSMQGRIDDPNGGWKGRGFWTSYNTYTPWHVEGGKGTKNKVVKIQFRPDPLAK